MDQLPPEVLALPESQLRALRETFRVLDPAGEGLLAVAELPLAVRSLGLHPSELELKALVETHAQRQTHISFVRACSRA
jgi:Ca2+-binding EF-hand superfamily protein